MNKTVITHDGKEYWYNRAEFIMMQIFQIEQTASLYGAPYPKEQVRVLQAELQKYQFAEYLKQCEDGITNTR